MPRLQFKVTGQKVIRTDTTPIVAKSLNYFGADFEFLTEDWQGFSKTAIFATKSNAYGVLIDENGQCDVPWEAIDNMGYVTVSVFGGNRITTDLAKFFVAESGYKETETTQDPTPTVYEQIIGYFDETKEIVAQSAEAAADSADEASDYADAARGYAETAEYHSKNVDGGSFTDWREG